MIEGEILFGLGAIKGTGDAAVSYIIEERNSKWRLIKTYMTLYVEQVQEQLPKKHMNH